MDIPEEIRAKKRKITGNVREDVKRNKNSGSPYQTLKQKRPIPGKRFCEEVSKNNSFIFFESLKRTDIFY